MSDGSGPLVCLDENVGSIKTIKRNGGVLEKVCDDGHGMVRHYWIELLTEHRVTSFGRSRLVVPRSGVRRGRTVGGCR